MAHSCRSSLVAGAVAATLVAATLPAQTAPWAKSGMIAAEPVTEQVDWRGRRNGALVAGAIGVGVLGIAAAAAAQERRGYYGGGYYDEPRYGYGPSYGYAPRYSYEPRPTYEYEYVQPRRRYVEGPVYGHGPVYRDDGYRQHRGQGYIRGQRGRDSAGSGSK